MLGFSRVCKDANYCYARDLTLQYSSTGRAMYRGTHSVTDVIAAECCTYYWIKNECNNEQMHDIYK